MLLVQQHCLMFPMKFLVFLFIPVAIHTEENSPTVTFPIAKTITSQKQPYIQHHTWLTTASQSGLIQVMTAPLEKGMVEI